MNPRVTPAAALLGKFGWEVVHCVHVSRLATMLFDQLQPLHELGMTERDILAAAALLHDIGWTITGAKHHKLSADLIRQNAAQLPGFSPVEVELIANVARYHRKALPALKHEPFAALSPREQSVVKQLAALLRVADGLDRPHLQAVRSLTCRRDDRSVEVTLEVNGSATEHVEGARRKCDLFEIAYGRPVEFRFVT